MLPLMLTDRHGETYAIFRADDIVPFGYYPADIDRGFGWAERFVFSLTLTEQKRLRDYAYGIRPFFGLDPLIELLAQRRLLVYRKDTSKDDKLAIEVLRNSIREVLDQILAEEKKEADAIAREHEKRNILEKAAAYKQEFDKGMVEGAWSLLKFLKEVNDVVSPMMILTRAGKSAWDAAEGGLQGFAGRFSRNMNTAQYREIVEALGFDPAEIDQKTLYLAFDIANVVWEDEDTQAIITSFAKNLAAAQHSLEWANIAGGAAFEIVLTAILAALTAGAGATVALAGKGKYLRKLGALLKDLAEPLKRLKRRWGKGSRGKGAGSGKKATVEQVETPGYNEPPKSDKTHASESLPVESEGVKPAPSKRKANSINSPKEGYDAIESFRKKAGLQPYGPKSGDTVALVEVNGNKYYGVNSQITKESQIAQKPLREKWIKEVQWVPPKKAEPKHLGQVQSLTHGESHALIRAYERNNGQLPKEMNMYVDRKTCNMCKGEMPALLKRLGVEKLNVYSGGSTKPLLVEAVK